jgi:NAD dependent epimerase/dehydratase family enzyme
MARIKIEDVIDHLSYEMRRALEDAVNNVAPDTKLDTHELFRAFCRGIRRKCNTWENIPDNLVERDD